MDDYKYDLPPTHKFSSPFLPSDYLQAEPDDGFIYYNSHKPVRGRMEHSFFEIGVAVLAGGALGSLQGFLQGKEAAFGHPKTLRRIVLFNHIVKRSKLGNSLGMLALLYAGSGVALSELRGKEDGVTTVMAATTAGSLYQIYGGPRKVIYGALTGFSLGTVLISWQGTASLWNEWKAFLTGLYQYLIPINTE